MLHCYFFKMTPKESLREYIQLRTHSINNSPLGRKKLDTSLALEEGNSCFVSNERNIWIWCFLLRNTTLDPHNANCSRTNRRAFKIFTHLFIFQWCLSWNISMLPEKYYALLPIKICIGFVTCFFLIPSLALRSTKLHSLRMEELRTSVPGDNDT